MKIKDEHEWISNWNYDKLINCLKMMIDIPKNQFSSEKNRKFLGKFSSIVPIPRNDMPDTCDHCHIKSYKRF